MKLALVSWHFPPTNTIAAVRLGKLARYLVRAGHEIRVITAEQPNVDRSLSLAIDESFVSRTGFADIDAFFDLRRWRGGGGRKPGAVEAGAVAPRKNVAAWHRSLAELYYGLIFFPDRQVGWARQLSIALDRTIATFRPDLLLASGPPFSPFLCTARAARRAKLPWIAEFRDRWADDTYPELPAWRRPIDRWLERQVVRSAAGIITVSEPWREFYASKYGVPAATVMNGYDPADLVGLREQPTAGLPLRILHIGTIYQDRRDPSMLLQAIAQGGFSPAELRLVFYGQYLEGVAELARRFDVEAFVELRSTVPYRQALELQKGADLLLLLQWNAASELGNVPGKLFEYLATGRPILGLGPEAGVPARMVRKRGAGLFSNDPTVIAGYLRDRVEEKRRSGVVAPLPETAREGLTRDEQYAHLERFLQDLLTSRRPAAMNIGEDMELSRRIQAELVPPGSARRERDVAPSDLAAEYESSSFGSPR